MEPKVLNSSCTNGCDSQDHTSRPSEEMLELFRSNIDALMQVIVPAQRQGLSDHEAREAVHRYCQKVMAETILRMSEVDHVLELPPNKRSKDGPECKTGGTTQPWAEMGGAKAREKMARASIEEQELGLEMEKLRLENARMAVEVKRLKVEVEKVKMEAAVAAVDIAKGMAGAGAV